MGFARRDITPPFGIYARLWGAADHDASEGTHRPLSTTAMAIGQTDCDQPLLLVSIDSACIGDLAGGEERYVREGVFQGLGISEDHLMIVVTHTHASPWPARSRSDLPGGDLIAPYLEQLRAAVLDACEEAISTMQDATLTLKQGRCNLATNRDMPDPAHDKDRFITGYNPDAPADDTLMVGRITRNVDDQIIGTVVNYACHPTTLAWDNKLISPDYIGAMRELVEHHTGGAPCLFLQGASGDLAPAYQYVGDPTVPDSHGRQLGFAVLATLEAMLPSGHMLAFERVVESGAPLAVWRPIPFDVSTKVMSRSRKLSLPTKDWPPIAELEGQMATCTDRFAQERLFRKLQMVRAMDDSGHMPSTIWVWRLGKTLFVGHQNEAYSVFQQTLREAFPDYGVVAMNCANYSAVGYLVPEELADEDLYTAWQTPFGRKALGIVTQSCLDSMKEVTK